MGEMTHSAECYKVHHACAVAEIKRLRARVAELEARPIDRERLAKALLLVLPCWYDDGEPTGVAAKMMAAEIIAAMKEGAK